MRDDYIWDNEEDRIFVNELVSVLDLVPDHDQQESGWGQETTPVEIDDQTEEKTHDVEVPQDGQMSMPDFGT